MSFDLDALEREVRRHVRSGHGGAGAREMADTPRFEFEPEPLSSWLRNPQMLGTVELSEIQYDAMRHAERVLYPETFTALGWEPVRSVLEINLAWGKGSGKDFLSRIILSRALYLLLTLESPQAYFGMAETETISVTNIATAAPQAKHIFFDPWVRALVRSPFFGERIDPLTRSIEVEKNLLAISGHSSVESQEGQNLLVAVLDELAGFKTAHELDRQRRLQDREPAQSAEGIHRLARSSVTSRFPETGKVIALSFTRFKNDAIDSLVNRAVLEFELEGASSRKFASRAATWEVNPLRSRSDFDDEYKTDPQDAQCRYECRPLASPHRFFQNLIAVRQALGAPLAGELAAVPAEPTVAIEYVWGRDPDDPTLPESWSVEFDFTALAEHRNPLAIHLDIGISHDLAGMAASHVDGWKDIQTQFVDDEGRMRERTVRKPVVVTDFVVAFERVPGDPERDIPSSDIQIRWLRNLVLELIARGWMVGMVTADGYQSTDTLQLLGQQGIETGLYSLDRTTEGFDTLKSMIADQAVRAPFHPLLFAEMESLTKVTDKKINHQAGSSKDMADAWAGSVRGAVTLAEQGGALEDAWSGGNIEELAVAEVAATKANRHGWMMSPTISDHAEDHRFDGGGPDEWELERQRFEEAMPERS